MLNPYIKLNCLRKSLIFKISKKVKMNMDNMNIV
jgi:hypothetical protein